MQGLRDFDILKQLMKSRKSKSLTSFLTLFEIVLTSLTAMMPSPRDSVLLSRLRASAKYPRIPNRYPMFSASRLNLPATY